MTVKTQFVERLLSGYVHHLFIFSVLLSLFIAWIQMQVSQEYIQAYVNFGRELTHSPLLNSLKSKIVDLLPKQEYKALDLGSPSYHYADEIMLNAESQGKKGQFIVIDPFPVDCKVIKTTAEDFMRNSCPVNIDLILIKEAIHFFPQFKQLMQDCHSKLSSNGVIVIFMLSKETTLPWTQPLQKSFEKSCFEEQKFQEVSEMFKIECDRQVQLKQIAKKNLIGLIKNRGWSNLFKNSDKEIDECVKMIESQQGELLPAKIIMAAYYLHKK